MTKKIRLKFKAKEKQQDLSAPWNVLVVDDESDIHRITELALSGFSFQNRQIRFLNAYSGGEAKEILQKYGEDISVILLDVVMETDDAGLQVVNFMRNNLNNLLTRVILRTGQPGTAPEAKIINNYDINDYKTKSELTQSKLFSTVRSAIKSYRELVTIQRNRLGLEKIITNSLSLFKFKSFEAFVSGILAQLVSIMDLKDNTPDAPINAFAYVEPIGRTNLFFSGTGVYNQKETFSEEILSSVTKALLKEMKESQAIRCKTIHKENSIMIGIWQNNKLVTITFMEGCPKITPDIIALIEIFSANMSLALENISIVERLESVVQERTLELRLANKRLTEQAATDGLTGLYNRRYFFERLEEEISRQKRDGTHLSALLIDLDSFKNVNDTYGHPQGDKVLAEFANILKKRCRLNDICGRIGGEEFGVILPNTNVVGAMNMAEAIRGVTEKHRFQRLDGKGSISITVSIGGTTSSPEKVLTASRFYKKIDDFLYKAKSTGRNRVIYG